ncbi:MAG: extracellular solute-binding protein [Phycisphaerae bacterium]|nr:extracellular solute-binding protein [Phycisphaerae bacterium]
MMDTDIITTMRKTNYRQFSRLVAVVLFVTTTPGFCREASKDNQTAPTPTKKQITLRAWGVPTDISNVNSLAEARIISAFQKRFPHIHPVSTTGLQIPNKTMDMTPLMQIAGEIPPHVMYVNFRQSDTYIRNKFLYPLDAYIEEMLGVKIPNAANLPLDQYLAELKKSPNYQKFIGDRVPYQCWKVMRRKCPYGEKCPYAKVNGGDLDFDPEKPHEHVWAFPQGPVVRAIFFRKDLLTEAGLPLRPPKDMEEFIVWARKLTEPSEERYGLQIVLAELSWSTLSFLYSMGGLLVDEDQDGNWRCVFDSDEAVEAYYYVARLFHEPFITPKGKKATSVVYPGENIGGQIRNAMFFAYLDQRFFSQYDPTMYGFGPVPEGPTGKRGSEFNSRMTGIFAGIEDKDLRDAAWEYIRFYDGPEANVIRAKVYTENGLAKYVQPKYLRAAGFERQARQVPKEWLVAYEEALKGGIPEPYGKNCQRVYQEASKAVDQIRTDPDIKRLFKEADEYTFLGNQDRAAQITREIKDRIREILVNRNRVTNESLLGNIPPEKQKFRETVAAIVAILILILFIFVFWLVFRSFAASQQRIPGQKVGRWEFIRYKWAYLILIPAIGSLLLWAYYPLLKGTIISFQDYNVRGFSTWVGMKNFADVLFHGEFWHSMLVSLKYAVLFAFFGFTAPIALAVLLSEVPRGKIFYRTMFYLPAVLTGLIMIYLWRGFYGQFGMVNQVINIFVNFLNWFLPQSMELSEIHRNWLEDPNLAMICILLPVIWAGMGPGCLIYLAALKTIPEEIYEAADLDGAGVWTKTFHVALPNIKMLIMINFIGAMVATFKGGGQFALAMTGGGPYTPEGQTEFIGLHIYYQAFASLRFGAATAMAWVLASFLIGFTVLQLQRLSKMEFRTARGVK